MHSTFRLFFLAIILTAFAPVTRGCDLCGCYTPQLEALPQAGGTTTVGQPAGGQSESWSSRLYGGVAEQFTEFDTLQLEGREVPNPSDQHLESSITQLVVGYSLTSRFALQLNVPLIYRSFERPEGFATDRGTESGVGDMSLLLKTVLFHFSRGGGRGVEFPDGKNAVMVQHDADFTASAILLTGTKFPTGNTDRLREEFDEVAVPSAPESGIHGHDLTLGSGSYDGLVGAQCSMRYQSWFLQADTQFMLRGGGDYHYDFANDISWIGGPGYYFVRKPNVIVGLQCAVSGEYKETDRFRGAPAVDTGITSVFLGPRLLASLGKFSGELGVDLPISIENTALQAVPDYRLRASLAVRF